MTSRIVEIEYVSVPGAVGIPLEFEDADPLELAAD